VILQKREIMNNTDAQVSEYLTAALLLVAELDPPGDLREAVFNQAVGLYSGKQIVVEQIQPNGLSSLGVR
jgi:hypothetical protein